jgi:hypothetical protein
MDLTEQEFKAAQKQIKTWEKFACYWPKLRWAGSFVGLLLITSVFMGYQATAKMKEHNIHNSLLFNGTISQEIGTYVDARIDLLRAEMRFYNGSLIISIMASGFLVSLILGLNRHKYISEKIIIFRKLIEEEDNRNSS